MRFSTRVLLFVLGIMVPVTGILVAADDWTTQAHLERQFSEHYLSLGRSLAGAFTQVEAANDVTIRNALWVLRDYQRSHPEPSGVALAALAAQLGVTCLGMYDHHGVSEVFSADPNARGTTKLFARCASYPEEIFERHNIVVTPFAPKASPNESARAAEKFAFMASADGQHVLGASVLANHMNQYLRDAMAGDSSVVNISLRSHDGVVMASADNPQLPKPQHLALGSGPWSPRTVDGVLFQFDPASSVAPCCNCAGQGAQARLEPTAYRLEITASLTPLGAATRERRREKVVVVGILALGCALVVPLLARRLVARIDRVSAAAHAVVRTNALSITVPEDSGDDEVSRLSRAFNEMLRGLQRGEQDRAEKESWRKAARVATQVAHDIRSPLAALQIVAQRATELQENKGLLLRDAIQRIGDIANNLLTYHREAHDDGGDTAQLIPTLITSLVQSIISEQRVLASAKGVEVALHVAEDAYNTFARVEPSQFRRAFANLFSNALEAMGRPHGAIVLTMQRHQQDLVFHLKDDGCGIAPADLSRVLQWGVTVGKPAGHGMGLSSAKEVVEAWGGKLTLESTQNVGTTVQVTLPVCPPALWFARDICVPTGTTVLVLDDDEAMGRVWHQRFDALAQHGIRVRVCRRVADFEACLQEPEVTVGACLVDYELVSEGRSGLDVVLAFGLNQCTTIVTSYYEDPHVLAQCAARNVKMLPKAYAARVQIKAI